MIITEKLLCYVRYEAQHLCLIKCVRANLRVCVLEIVTTSFELRMDYNRSPTPTILHQSSSIVINRVQSNDLNKVWGCQTNLNLNWKLSKLIL